MTRTAWARIALVVCALLATASCGLHADAPQTPAAAVTTAVVPPSPPRTDTAPPVSTQTPATRTTTAPPAAAAPASAPAPAPVQAAPPGDALWGRSFTSTSVREGGRPRALVPGTMLRVEFERRGTGGVVRWRAGCNTMGTDVTIGPRTVDLQEPISGTAAGCAEDRLAQDAWTNDFFRADPEYLLDGRRLVLQDGDVVIELVEGPA